jgi:hypothetical protein
MVACSLAQGGLVTFLPLAVVDGGALVPAALLAAPRAACRPVHRGPAGRPVRHRRPAGSGRPPRSPPSASPSPRPLLGSGPAVIVGAVLVGAGFGAVRSTR